MGRFGGLFKKSDKEKAETNPYAQQPTASQSSPPPQYDQYTQHNAAQYNANQYGSQGSQGAPSGLPSGPRPGGLPSRVASGYGNEKSPPPQYSPQPSPYGRGSPSAPSSTSTPPTGTGFPREKYGASDGVGRNRFEPAPSPYNNAASTPSQRQGGYGNLDDSNTGALFANYNGSSRQTTGPRPGQTDAPYDPSVPYGEGQEMTEEERQEAEVQGIKSQIMHEIKGTSDSAARSEAKVNEALARALAMTQQTFEQGDRLDNADRHGAATYREISKGKVNLSALDSAQKMLNFAGNSKTAIQMREERKMGYDREHQQELDSMEQERKESRLKYVEMQGQIEAQNQQQSRTLLGGGKASKYNFEDEEFEDDTGEQRMHNEQIRDHQDAILQGLRKVNGVLKIQGEELDRQVKQIDRMTERTERNTEGLWKNRVHLESKYLK